ncbi:MAG: hypothetical protein JNM84_10365 [Planctomycetes bacterium]|nr:hypothetical protein [Planctomycetota bacterium]
MAKRQPRSFTPPKKSDRRTTSEPEKKGREKAAAPAAEVEEAPEKPGMPFEDILVLITTIGLVLGCFIGISALGKNYGAGPMSDSYKAPSKGDVVDPGTVKLRVSNVK